MKSFNMKKSRLLFSLLVLIAAYSITNSSCVSNSKELLYGCDSLNVSYSKTVAPILVANCYKCHSNANATTLGGGTVLEGHTAVYNWINPTVGSDGGPLLQNIKHLGNPMPKSAAKLSDCDIAKIEHWIFEGGLDN